MIYPVVLLTANRQNLSTTFKTQIAVHATTSNLRRFSVASFSLGAADVPNVVDCAIEWELARMTADGTPGATFSTGFMEGLETGTQLIPAATMKIGYTAEPTVTASSQFGDACGAMNQRGFFRWVAIDKDAEPKAPAVANNGIVLRALSTSYASKLACGLNFRE